MDSQSLELFSDHRSYSGKNIHALTFMSFLKEAWALYINTLDHSKDNSHHNQLDHSTQRVHRYLWGNPSPSDMFATLGFPLSQSTHPGIRDLPMGIHTSCSPLGCILTSTLGRFFHLHRSMSWSFQQLTPADKTSFWIPLLPMRYLCSLWAPLGLASQPLPTATWCSYPKTSEWSLAILKLNPSVMVHVFTGCAFFLP